MKEFAANGSNCGIGTTDRRTVHRRFGSNRSEGLVKVTTEFDTPARWVCDFAAVGKISQTGFESLSDDPPEGLPYRPLIVKKMCPAASDRDRGPKARDRDRARSARARARSARARARFAREAREARKRVSA